MKANCYDCQFRGTIPGSAHSKCDHPSVKEVSKDPLIGIMSILGSVGRVPAPRISGKDAPKFSDHGIRGGWANWPFNFDPTWLEECKLFKEKTNE